MPGNHDHPGLPVRWSDGSFLDRRTWPVTVSTLTPDLLGDWPVQATLKPAAGQHALLDIRPLSAPKPPTLLSTRPRMTVGQPNFVRLPIAQPGGWLQRSTVQRRTLT